MRNLFLINGLLLLLIACSEDTLKKDSGSVPIAFRTITSYTEIGDVHNDALDLVYNSTVDWVELTEAQCIDSAFAILVPFISSEVPGATAASAILYASNLAEDCFDDSDYGDHLDLLDTYRDTATLFGGFSGAELDLLDRYYNLLAYDYTYRTNQQITKIFVDSLTEFVDIIENDNVNFTRNELLASFYVGQKSALYWDAWLDGTPGGNGDGPIGAIIQFDCVGYLVGWFRSWANAQGPEYSNSSEAQWGRIEDGLYAAGAASTMRGLGLRKR